MKIALVSDLHLEFAPIELPPTGADILLLAGDIVPFAYLSEHRTDAESRKVKNRVANFIANSLYQYKQVFHIMGNHEYYKGVWETVVKEFREYWDKKTTIVKVLNNEATDIGGLKLWGGALWTSFSGGNPIFMEAARDGLNDYHLISKFTSNPGPYSARTTKLLPGDTQEEHETARYALKEDLEQYPDVPWVVMTHHAPSWRSIDPIHAGSILNHAYASDLDPFIEDHPQIKTWVHGHTHHSCSYSIGVTNILCNPRGYAHSNKPNKPENSDFNSSLVFEV